ncbi:MBL fold metallo-hydrolase [Spirochaetota bacterium]
MKITFLGTNGWYDTDTGNTICTLIDAGHCYIVLDAGNGFYKLDKYATEKKPIYLYLSHFHLDHIIGLHTLLKFNFTQGLYIFGQKGIKKHLKAIMKKPYTASLSELPFKTEILEIPGAGKKIPFNFTSLPLKHSAPCYGIRLEMQNRVISYCPDTGYCENAVKLSMGSDLLIAECAQKSGREDENWPHLNPKTAAQIASEANAKKLVLVHFSANDYLTMEERENAGKESMQYFPDTIAAKDNMILEI